MRRPLWITVPTYWGENGTEEHPADTGAFDHPTPIDGPQTLERTVNSLCSLPQDFTLLIILAVTHSHLQEAAEQAVRKILGPYTEKKPICLVTGKDVDALQESLEIPSLCLKSYGSIRNVQLAVPYLCGAEYVVAIDDDEVIGDSSYLDTIVQTMRDQPEIHGMSGVYLNPEGGYLLPTEGDETMSNPFLKKAHLINLAVDEAMQDSVQPHASHVAFGGNMVFSRRLMASICHDEYIARGEDFDYVINALNHGFSWFFHRDIPIVHLPPKHSGITREAQMQKMLSDFSRFLYALEKQSRYPELDLSPYPGPFLHDRESLYRYCVDALRTEFPDLCSDDEAERLVSPLQAEAQGMIDSYETYRTSWETTMKSHENRDETVEYMENLIESCLL